MLTSFQYGIERFVLPAEIQAETTRLAETRSDAIVIPPVAEIKTMAQTVLSDAGLRAQWMRRGLLKRRSFL